MDKTPLDTMIDGLVDDLKEVVLTIEKSPKTTQNHYGRYMSLLSSLSHGDARMSKIIALALIKAGANRQGVASALQLVC